MKTETTIIKVDPAEFGLENDKAVEVESAFAPVIVERDALIDVYQNIITSEMSKQLTEDAKSLRLKLVKVRTKTNSVHQVQKAFYLAGGRFVDAWKNRNNTVIEQMEENLSEIENYYVNIEKDRIAALKIERNAILSQVCDTPDLYQVELMTDEAFENLIAGQKLVKDARIEAERKAEEARIAAIEAERIEQERIRKENETLKAEAERKQKEFEAEQAKQSAALKAEQEKADKERKEAEAKAAKERAEAEAKLKDEQEVTAKLRAEIEAKEKAELKAKQDAEIAAKKSANAPIKTKVTAWVESLEMPDMGDNATVLDIRAKFYGFKNWAKTQLINL